MTVSLVVIQDDHLCYTALPRQYHWVLSIIVKVCTIKSSSNSQMVLTWRGGLYSDSGWTTLQERSDSEHSS